MTRYLFSCHRPVTKSLLEQQQADGGFPSNRP